MKNHHIKVLNVLWSLKYRKTQRDGIHQSPNQTPHLPHLKFKLDPLNLPSGVAILWAPHFARCVPTWWRNSLFYLFSENLIFRKRLGVTTYFYFIFEGKNKIRKKNPKCDSWRKKQVYEKLSLGSGIRLLIGKVW